MFTFTLNKVWADASAPSSLGFSSLQYVSENQAYFRQNAEGSNPGLFLKVNDHWRRRRWQLDLNIENQMQIGENKNYIKPYAAQVSWRAGLSRVGLGRRSYNWGHLDRQWHQGVYEPRFMDDKIAMESQGLTGVSYEWLAEKGLSAQLVGILVNVPDLGPDHSVRDGQFTSKNPWFNPPAAQLIFQDQVTDIEYSVKPYEAEEILGKVGVAARLNYEYQGWYAATTYAYKPMSQVLLAFPTAGRFRTLADRSFLDLEIQPRVLYHRVAGMEFGRQWQGWEAAVSGTWESPLRDVTPEDWVTQETGKAFLASATLIRRLDGRENGDRLDFSLIKIWGGDEADRGEFAGDTTLFERRYQYTEAASASYWQTWSWRKSPLLTRVRIAYDRLQNGGLLSLEARWWLNKQWMARAQADFLGLLSETASIQDGYFSSYRANDRVGVGLSHAF